MARSAWPMMIQWQSWPAVLSPLKSLETQFMVLKHSKIVLESRPLPQTTNWCMETKLLIIICLKLLRRNAVIPQPKPWRISPIQGSITLLKALITRLTRPTPSFSRLSSKVSSLERVLFPTTTTKQEGIHPPMAWNPCVTTRCGKVETLCIRLRMRFYLPMSQRFRFATPMLRGGAKSHPLTAIFSMVSPMLKESWDKRTIRSTNARWHWPDAWPLTIRQRSIQPAWLPRAHLTRWSLYPFRIGTSLPRSIKRLK